MGQTDFIRLGLAVVETELASVATLKQRIDDNFARACELMLGCTGRIVVTGMGKSGHIAGKIAATLASTGSPAFFVHPGEASHGDLGMITPKDVVIALSNSGNTGEILTIVPIIKRLGVPLISMTGNARSPLAAEATINLDVGVENEACPLGLAPTSSTTVALVMGDALAVALLETRGFTEEDFALSHPGGSLGRRLLLHVSDKRRLEQFIVEALVHQVSRGEGGDTQEFAHLLLAQQPEFQADLGEGEQLTQRVVADAGHGLSTRKAPGHRRSCDMTHARYSR